MATNTSNTSSQVSEAEIARIRRKLLKEVESIRNQDVNESMIKSLPCVLHYFSLKNSKKEYHVLNNLILRYMATILDVEKRCNTEHLKEIFDNILPELTESCAIIGVNADNAPFLLQFFSIWSEIVSGTNKSIQRFTGLHKISALVNICETIFKTGHFHTQLNGLELLLRYVGAYEGEDKAKVLKEIIPSQDYRRIRDLLCNIDISNFEFDGRNFLNEFNMIISDEEPVYSIAVEKGYIDEKPIIKPMHEAKECVLWVDFNSATKSISFYCDSTTFFPNTENWTNIEVKFPTKINIERGKCEFQVFANRDNIDVNPPPTREIFFQTKIMFRFTYVESDLSNLQEIVSLYNSKKFQNTVTECDNLYTGFKTIIANREREWLAPKLPVPKIEIKIRKQNLTREHRPQNGPEKHFFVNITSRTNKNQKDVLAFKSDISSVQNTSTDNKKFSTEEICSTSDTSKVNMQRTTDLAESNIVTKDSKLYIEKNKKDKITNLKATFSAHKRNEEINNRRPFKEMTNYASANQKVKNSDKANIETVVHDNAVKSGKVEMNSVKYENREMNNVASGSHISGKSHTKTIVHNNRETINAKGNQKTNTKNSSKAEIETVVNDSSSQKVNTEKSGKTKIETISYHEIPNNTNPMNELDIPISQNTSALNPEIIAQKKNSDYIQKECGPETSTKKVFDTDIENPRQSPKSASKRKLYHSTPEVHKGSQLSKDSQLQRRKYLQERRKTENRNSLKLINLVKPMEFSEKNDEVKDHEISKLIDAPIAGNEEKIQEVVDEYVENKGLVGISNSLKCPGVADKFTPQQQEVIENNLKTLNSIFVNSANKFFKSDKTLPIEQLDVYNARNIEDDPAPAKKGRKGKAKTKIIRPIKMNVVPKYAGTNIKVSHSYRRSKGSKLGSMKKVLTTKDATDFDELKKGVNCHTNAESSEPVNVAAVDPVSTTAPVEITAVTNVTPRKTLSSKSFNNTIEGNNTQVQQISNQNFNLLSNQAVQGENSTQSPNRNYTSEGSLTQPFVRNEAIDNQFIKTKPPSPEIERCTSAMANQSMAPNISCDTKDSSGNRHEAKQQNNFEKQALKRDNAQNDSLKTNSMERVKLTEAKPGKYTSYGQNGNRNLEKILERSNYPSSEITDITNAESNWLIQKFLDSIPNESYSDIEIQSSNAAPIIKNGQTSCEVEFLDNREEHCLNNFEDDNVDLDSYYAPENNELQLQGCQRKESLEKRKGPNSESKEIVPYKRVRTETTTEYNGTGIGGEILSNLQRKLNQVLTNAVSNIKNNSDSEEIKGRLIEQLSSFSISCERHDLQASESWEQIEKLLAEVGKEKERFHLESFAVFNQFSRTREALAELEKISKAKDAEQLNRFEKVRSSMRETVVRMAKSEWAAHLDSLSSNIIKKINRHKNFDLPL